MWTVLAFFSALFAFFYLLSTHTHPHHHHVIFQTAHLPPDSHSWIPKHRLWQRCLWIRPGDECPDKTSAVSKGKKYTHTTSVRKSPNQKKKEQKKEVKHRRSPYCPQTPALHPSLPSAPLLCLLRSDQRAKRKEEKRRRRRRRSQERRSQRYEKLQGKTRRRGGGEEEGRRAGGGALEAADQKTKK